MTRKWSGFGSELGRSMIEMLGVLAIVGILSVGAISGFSKAMTKYKINRLTEEYIQFIADFLHNEKDFIREKQRNNVNTQFDLDTYIAPLGILPQNWKQERPYIIDSQENKLRIQIRHEPGHVRHNKPTIILQIKQKDKENDTADMCTTLFTQVIKQYYDIIVAVHAWGQDENNNAVSGRTWYGTNYCTKGRYCISNITLQQIYDLCHACITEKGSCGFLTTFE